MDTIEEILMMLAPFIAGLVKLAMADSYDPEAEKQLMLDATRAASDYRMKKALGK